MIETLSNTYLVGIYFSIYIFGVLKEGDVTAEKNKTKKDRPKHTSTKGGNQKTTFGRLFGEQICHKKRHTAALQLNQAFPWHSGAERGPQRACPGFVSFSVPTPIVSKLVPLAS